MSKHRGVSGFWLDIKALENHRAHFVGEFGAKEGLLLYGFWVRIFTWQYQSATPIRDATHAARLTGLNVRTAQRLMRSLAQSLPQSFIQRSGQWYCKRTIQVLSNYNQKQELAGATHDPIKVEDSDSDSDSKKEEEKKEEKTNKKEERKPASQRSQGQSPRQQGTNPRKLPPLAEPLPVDGVDMEAWAAYEAYRRERRLSKLKPASVTRLQRWLVEQSDQAAVVDQTIRNGWTGLFELKTQKPRSGNGAGGHQSWKAMVEALGREMGVPAKPGEDHGPYYARLQDIQRRAH